MNVKTLLNRIVLCLADILFCDVSIILSYVIAGYDFPESALFLALFLIIEPIALIILLAAFKGYRSLLRYFGLKEGVFLVVALLLFCIGNVLFSLFSELVPLGIVFIFCLLIAFATIVVRLAPRAMVSAKKSIEYNAEKNSSRVLIIGAGDAGHTIAREMLSSDRIDKRPVAFIDDNPLKTATTIMGVPVVGGRELIEQTVEKENIDEIVIALPSMGKREISELIQIAGRTKAKVSILPGLYELVNGSVSLASIRDVKIEDLLGRDPVTVNLDEIMGYISGKTVLVTGGGGSIGSELCRQIARHSPKRLIILDIYENNAYDIQQELKRELPALCLTVLIASVRDAARINSVFETYRPEIVFNAAAHKHVPLMEESPHEAVKNNVFGTFNVASAAAKYGSERFVQISTDKAVNPTNVMGATKRICEMIIQTMGKRFKSTSFVAVRFGNVLGSNGSVIPLFKKQIEEGGPVTVTHKDIVRYFMTIPEAVSLVLQAGAYAKGGQIFVLDMGEQVKIYDLAVNLIRLSGLELGKDIEIKVTGLRPGEKLYEERLMDEEGLEKTANGKISVARPIHVNADKFFADLADLKTLLENEEENIRPMIKRIVPTYILPENVASFNGEEKELK